MITFVIVVVFALLACAWFTLRAVTHAGEGYEDDFGFHSGRLDARRRSRFKRRRSSK